MRRRKSRKNQRGQTMLEYVLLLMVIVGIFILVVKPFFGDFREMLAKGLKTATFDPDNPNYYYYPVR